MKANESEDKMSEGYLSDQTPSGPTLTDHAHFHKADPSPSPPVNTTALDVEQVNTAISTIAGTPTKIPRAERRGLFARFAVVAEVDDPTLYTRSTKWMITAIVAGSAAAAPMGSAIIMPSLLPIAADFNTTPTITNLSVALYMLSMSIFPLWWSSFSETLGRRTIYITSFALFTIFGVLSAISTSIGMLIAMRMLSGGAAASVQAVGAGTIADMWETRERGRAMGIFYLGPLCGPLIAPIIGGILAESHGWRSTQWFLVALGGFLGLALIFLLPETLHRRKDLVVEAAHEGDAQYELEVALAGGVPIAEKDIEAGDATALRSELSKTTTRPGLARMTTRQSVVQNSKVWVKRLRRWFIDPLEIVLLLRFPAVAITVYWASITFGSLYFLNVSIEDSFSRAPYNFSTLIVGLLYIPNSLGYVVASIFGGRWLDYIMKREAKKAGRFDEKGKLVLLPEDRMRENAWLAAFMFPIALIWYGWAVEKGVHWIVPMIANFFFGVGSMIVFGMATTILTEFVSERASTGIAVNNFVRNIFSCVGTLSAAPAIHSIGNGWLFTILCILSCVSGVGVTLSMRRFGPRWRESMDRAMAKT